MIYLDTSALAKLIVRETETATLSRWLRQHATQLWVTSIIGRIELVRVARRFAADGARLLLAGLDTVPLVEHVADVAQTTGSVTLRTLDAIHLASALSVRDDLIAFCCYDRRLLGVAGDAGLRPWHVSGEPPGVNTHRHQRCRVPCPGPHGMLALMRRCSKPGTFTSLCSSVGQMLRRRPLSSSGMACRYARRHDAR